MRSRLEGLNAALAVADVCGRCAGRQLRAYQLEAISWALAGNYLNAFAVGMGKTATAVCSAVALDYPLVCFVVPAHLFSVWAGEIARWTGLKVVYKLLGSKRLRIEQCFLDRRGEVVHSREAAELPDVAWVLVSHETVAEWGRLVAAARSGGLIVTDADEQLAVRAVKMLKQPQLVVVDEVHDFGSTAAARTGGLHALCWGADRVIGLSATLLSGGLHRLWGPLVSLAKAWGSYNSFIERYCGAERDEWGALRPGLPTNAAELAVRLSDVVLHYDAKDFAHELPQETIQNVPVEVDSRTAEAILSGVLALQKRLRGHGELRADDSFARGEVQQLRDLLAEVKTPSVAALCRDLVASGERVLVWCWHHKAVEGVKAALEKAPRATCYGVHGGMHSRAIELALDAWTETPGAVLAATTELLGTGVDVLARVCRLQIFLEMPWRVDRWIQARGRLVRLSQQYPVVTYVPVAEVPFERSLFDRLLVEAQTTDSVLNERRGSLMAAALGIEPLTAQRLNDWLRD